VFSTTGYTSDDRARTTLRRGMPGVSSVDLELWLAVEPRAWIVKHGPTLYAAGLTHEDATDLYRRLGPTVASMLSSLVDAGRMADIDIRYVHLWAASGLLKPEVPQTRGRGAVPRFTRWVSEARKYIKVCGGDQHLAALAAASGLTLPETETMREAGELEVGALELLSAFREANKETSSEA
jgi:hypothetical protein